MSNITAGTVRQIQLVLDANLFPRLIEIATVRWPCAGNEVLVG